MPEDRPSDLARAVEGVRAQRTAEQSALRNVRKELDHLQAQDARQRKMSPMLTIGATIVLLILVFVAWRVLMSRADHQERNATPVQIPSKVDMSKKPAPKQAEAQK